MIPLTDMIIAHSPCSAWDLTGDYAGWMAVAGPMFPPGRGGTITWALYDARTGHPVSELHFVSKYHWEDPYREIWEHVNRLIV